MFNNWNKFLKIGRLNNVFVFTISIMQYNSLPLIGIYITFLFFKSWIMSLLLTNIGQLLTFDRNVIDSDQVGLLSDSAVICKNGSIDWIGSTLNIPTKYKNDKKLEVLDCCKKVVLPGLIDSHTHLVFAGSRENEFAARLEGKTYEEILQLGGGIHSTVEATRNASLDSLIELGKKRLDNCLEHGITTIEIKSGYGLDTQTELKILESALKLNDSHPVDVVTTFLGAHVIPKEYRSDRQGYVDLIINEMIPEVKKRNLASFCDVFIEETAFTVAEAEKIISAGLDNGMRPRLHVIYAHFIMAFF